MLKIIFVFLAGLTACSAQGLLGPHLKGSSFAFMGTINSDHCYAKKGEEGFAYTSNSDSGKVYTVDVIGMREDLSMLLRKPNSDMFATYLVDDSKAAELPLQDQNFQLGPSGSFAAEAWKRAENPSDFTKDTKGKWIFVSREMTDLEVISYYVGNKIERDPHTGIFGTIVISLVETRHLVEIIPSQNKFRATPISWQDLIPKREKTYKELNEGVLKILEFAKKQLGE